jgi:hypothetical protein
MTARGEIRAVLDDYAKRIGAYLDSTAVGNVGAGEDDLKSTTLPAHVLSETGDYVDIEAWGLTANNANAKTLKLYFGTVAILDLALTASIAGRWYIKARVVRTGNDTQDWQWTILEGIVTLAANKNAVSHGTATQDEEAILTVKLTGTGTANDDIVNEGLMVSPGRLERAA